MKTGMFISIEGPDGSGKTTCATKLVEYLNEGGFEAIYTKEPGGSLFGQAIRETLINFDETKETIDPTTRLLQFISLRVQHLKKTVIPALRAGKVVVCDRYLDSTDIYNGKIELQGHFLSQLYNTHALSFLKIRPDATLIFSVRKEVGLSRVSQRGSNTLDQLFASKSFELWTQKQEELIQTYGKDVIKVVDANSDLDTSMDRSSKAIIDAMAYFQTTSKMRPNDAYVNKTQDVYIR